MIIDQSAFVDGSSATLGSSPPRLISMDGVGLGPFRFLKDEFLEKRETCAFFVPMSF